jgi:hypothetical protein
LEGLGLRTSCGRGERHQGDEGRRGEQSECSDP